MLEVQGEPQGHRKPGELGRLKIERLMEPVCSEVT